MRIGDPVISHPDIHPDDESKAIEAKINQRVNDHNRRCNEKITAEQMRGRFVTIVLHDDFLTLISDKRFRLFDKIDIIILKNWRKGLRLRGLTRNEAVAALRKAKLADIPYDTYASRLKHLGLQRSGREKS